MKILCNHQELILKQQSLNILLEKNEQLKGGNRFSHFESTLSTRGKEEESGKHGMIKDPKFQH